MHSHSDSRDGYTYNNGCAQFVMRFLVLRTLGPYDVGCPTRRRKTCTQKVYVPACETNHLKGVVTAPPSLDSPCETI